MVEITPQARKIAEAKNPYSFLLVIFFKILNIKKTEIKLFKIAKKAGPKVSKLKSWGILKPWKVSRVTTNKRARNFMMEERDNVILPFTEIIHRNNSFCTNSFLRKAYNKNS